MEMACIQSTQIPDIYFMSHTGGTGILSICVGLISPPELHIQDPVGSIIYLKHIPFA